MYIPHQDPTFGWGIQYTGSVWFDNIITILIVLVVNLRNLYLCLLNIRVFHLRTTILPAEEDMPAIMASFKKFNDGFMDQYDDHRGYSRM